MTIRSCLRPSLRDVTSNVWHSNRLGRKRSEDKALAGAIATRLNLNELRAFEHWADMLGITPSELLRILIRSALKQRSKE